MNSAVESPPFRRVFVFDIHILEGDGEVNKVEVEVVNAPKIELVLDKLLGLRDVLSEISEKKYHRAYALFLVVGVPEL